MIVNSTPLQFNFADVEKCKNEVIVNKEIDGHQGIVEIKNKSSMNILKNMLNQSCWEMRYLVLKGDKLFVYKEQQVTKPIAVYSITKDL